MTPEQNKHADKAESLQREAARSLAASKSGRSDAAANRITEANKERQAAGLIKGTLAK